MIEHFDLPHNFSIHELNAMLLAAYDYNTSDITVQTNEPIWIEVNRELHQFTARKLQDNDVRMFVSHIYGDNAISILTGGNDLDFRYDVARDRENRIGFRVNATRGYIPGGIGIQLTLRTIPGTPKTLEELQVTEPEILENISPIQGMVLVVGVTGSGKSTLLAGAMRHKLEKEAHRKILTYEAPIEFVYSKIQAASSIIFQTEVPTHLRAPSSGEEEDSLFAYCVRNALRRKPTDILIGEARDTSTIAALIEASLTGHTTYSTVHADSVANTVSRMVLRFPEKSRASVAYNLISVLRLVIAQKLVPRVDGGQVALREYCAFTQSLRAKLLTIPHQNIPLELDKYVRNNKTSMFAAANRAHESNLIDDETFKLFQKESEIDALE
jgi:defect-in-organelle-trafficking protein DotB